jgi:hypothetical protein
MQTRVTAHLAQKLRRKHAETKSWEAAAIALNILTADGKPDKGMAFLIAMRGYEPARKETRLRLGLGRPPSHRIKTIHELPDNVLLWQFEHRVDM